MGRVVHELAGLSDGAVAALLEHAQALLMPSFAEGFCLPLTEAASLGTPIVATPLAAVRERLGDHATYVAADASSSWAEKILQLTAQDRDAQVALATKTTAIVIPSWTEHFNLVLKEM